MPVGAIQQVARAQLCEWLRAGAAPPAVIPEALLAAARDEGVHLLLADRGRSPALADELRASTVIEIVRAQELQAVLASLASHGVRPVLLKGAALAHTHYPRPELRPRSDTDVMIPAAARERVVRVLGALGYRRPAEVDGELSTGQFHFVRDDHHGVEHALDVHWRVSNVRAFADALSYDELARDGVPIPALGDHAVGASSVHALLLASVHRVAHHGDTQNLLWLYDVHLLARGLTAAERHAFGALASSRRMRAVCARTLTLAQAAFGGLDAAWIETLAPADGVDEPSAAFVGGGFRQVDILKADLAATPRWGARVQLLREHLFPRADFMYARYGTRLKPALPVLYLHRLVTGVPKWFRR